MRRLLLVLTAASGLLGLALAGPAEAIELRGRRAAYYYPYYHPWHGGFYNVSWGMPVALVVPPTAEAHTDWGWGVGNTRITNIRHQYQRSWPGYGSYDSQMFQPTPRWPSDTDQFGVYYVRGPW